MRAVAFDTETDRFGPGNLLPKLITIVAAHEVSWAAGWGNGENLRKVAEELLAPGHLLVGHYIAYDLAVIGKAFPDLKQAIYRKLEAGECYCTIVAEKLLNLAQRGFMDKVELPDGTNSVVDFSLASLLLTYHGIDRSDEKEMEDSVRLRYIEMDGLGFEQYPHDFRHYALSDATDTLRVYQSQQERARGTAILRPCGFQTAADYCMTVVSSRGFLVDKARVLEVKEKVEGDYNDPEKIGLLLKHGLVIPAQPERPYVRQRKLVEELQEKGITSIEELKEHGVKFKKAEPSKRPKKPLHEHIIKVCEEHGLPVKRTDPTEKAPEGNVSADKEVLANLSPYDPVLAQYEEREKLGKLVTTDLPSFEWPAESGEVCDEIYTRYNVLVETGRSSSRGNSKKNKKKASYPARNLQQVDPRIRPCHVARPGFLLFSIDYSTLELVSVAQKTYDLFGFSVHRDLINAGYDLHSYLGSQLALFLNTEFRELCQQRGILDDREAVYQAFMQCKTSEHEEVQEFFKKWRKFAKPVGLGYPGGLGAGTFIVFAKGTYGVDIAEMAEQLPEHLFEITPGLLWHAEKMGMTEETFVWTKRLKAIALAMKLKQIWLDTYPEMVRFFEWIRDQVDPQHPVLKTYEDGRRQDGLCYDTPMGMRVSRRTYTQACNGACMQSASAEGFKIALFESVKECEIGELAGDTYILNQVHDELIGETIDDEGAKDRVRRLQRIMEESMSKIMPDVTVRTEAVLMRRWYKEAESPEGEIIIWEPKEEE